MSSQYQQQPPPPNNQPPYTTPQQPPPFPHPAARPPFVQGSPRPGFHPPPVGPLSGPPPPQHGRPPIGFSPVTANRPLPSSGVNGMPPPPPGFRPPMNGIPSRPSPNIMNRPLPPGNIQSGPVPPHAIQGMARAPNQAPQFHGLPPTRPPITSGAQPGAPPSAFPPVLSAPPPASNAPTQTLPPQISPTPPPQIDALPAVPQAAPVDNLVSQLGNINIQQPPYGDGKSSTSKRTKRVYNFGPDGEPAPALPQTPTSISGPAPAQPQPGFNNFAAQQQHLQQHPGPQPPVGMISQNIHQQPQPLAQSPPPGTFTQQQSSMRPPGMTGVSQAQPKPTAASLGGVMPPAPGPVANGQDQRRFSQGSRNKIDPNQIPSPVQVQEADQVTFDTEPFGTCSKIPAPLASTDFRAIDQGNCNPRFMRLTTPNIPHTDDLAETSQIPMALIMQPFAKLRMDEEPINIVDFGDTGPVRCTRCKAYINPFVVFTDGGRKFICNLCGFDSEVPQEYFCNLDMNGRRVDIDSRPELKYGTCEFTVPKDYWSTNPPASIHYVIAIDVSWNAIQSGMLQQVCETLKEVLLEKKLPVGAKVGIMTYDRVLQFYNLKPDLDSAHMMVVADIMDVFVPLNEGFLVDPIASRNIIENLLDSLPDMFADNKVTEPALSAPVQAAFLALKEFGGRLILLNTALPANGLGILKHREDPKLYGTDKERTLFAPQDNFYKNIALECVDAGICVDMFFFPNTYCDVATVGTLSALTGGETYYYPHFLKSKDGLKFSYELKHNLTRAFGYNAVLRVRCSNGLKITDQLGNFHMKNSTDIELAGIDEDKSLGVAIKHDGKLDERTDASFQCAILYTTATGQRRVRIHNLTAPVTALLGNVFRYAEMDSAVNLIVKKAIVQSAFRSLPEVREAVTQRCVKILTSYRKNCASSTSPGQLILPESFKLFPLYALGMQKSKALRNGPDINSDLRTYAMRMISGLSVQETIVLFYPRLFGVHNMRTEDGETLPDGRVKIPQLVRLSYSRLDSAGVYILENGQTLMFWIGREVSPDFLLNSFGVNTLDQVNPALTSPPIIDNPLSQKLHNIINYMQSQRSRHLTFHIVRQSMDQTEIEFANLMTEDKNNDAMSYVDYLCFIHRQIQNEMSQNDSQDSNWRATY